MKLSDAYVEQRVNIKGEYKSYPYVILMFHLYNRKLVRVAPEHEPCWTRWIHVNMLEEW